MENRNITYLNKNFDNFRGSLKDFAKTYFPSSYNDFSDASVGMMYMEMASYVGDVLSFYLDTQFQENLLLYTKEKENILAMAYTLGYRPKMSYASTTTIDIYQLIPSKTVLGVSTPDWNYGLLIPANTSVLSSSTNQKFLTTDVVDFTDELAEISVYNSAYFLAKKSVSIISGELKSTAFTFGSPVKFNSITITDDKILQILSITSNDIANYYEVPYLAQETIINKTTNTNFLNDGIPYLLSYKKVPNRFVTRFQADGSLKIQFGAGTSNKTDSTILPTPDNTSLGLVSTISNLENNYNKAAIFFAKEYGTAPSNGTLTVNYIVGGGVASNVPANDITRLGVTLDTTYFPGGITILDPFYATIISNVIINNPNPAAGGKDGDNVDEIRLNTLSSFSAQDRAVTKEDYITRALSMPSEFGSVAKAYIIQDALVSSNSSTDSLLDNNPLSLSLYILGYDSDSHLTTASTILKTNLKNYIQNYRMVTDAINIKNAFVINISLNFDISVIPGFNNKEVLTGCLKELQDFFSIDKWQINQPIKLSEVYATLLKIKGVQSVLKVEIVNKQGGNYSQFGYDIAGATKNSIVYPSLDPSIFEIKYPASDIQGRVIAL